MLPDPSLYVSDLAGGQHYVVHELHREILPGLWKLIARSGHVPFISTYDGNADRCYYRDVTNGGMAWYVRDRKLNQDPRMHYLHDLERGLEDRRLVVFGDEKNDLGMFELADKALAVANAVPALMERATGIIDSNDADGVAKYIRHSWYGTRE